MNEFKGYFSDTTSFTGKLDTAVVEIHPQYESIEITPTTETQIREGLYNKVTVVGDENLKAENISKGTSIFGVDGIANATSIKITDASRLFYNGARIEYLNDFLKLCENVTNTNNMFSNCTSLVDLDLSNFDMNKVVNIGDMMYNMTKLANFRSFKNLGKAYTQKQENHTNYRFNLSRNNNLTHESLMDVINNLYDLNLSYDVANGGTLYRQSLTLGSTNLAKLTEEEIAIATNKGWNVT